MFFLAWFMRLFLGLVLCLCGWVFTVQAESKTLQPLLFAAVSEQGSEGASNSNFQQPKTQPKTVEQKPSDSGNSDSDNVDSAVTGSSRELRKKSDYFVYGIYSPLDLLLPNKWGVSFGSIQSPDLTLEAEYLKASVAVPFVIKDLGSMSDQRISLTARSFFGGNSFNMSYGLSYFSFSMKLGDELLNRVTGGAYPALDLVELSSLGVHGGLGNRWALSQNISLGVDWIAWHQPVLSVSKKSAFLDYASNAQDRQDVENAMNLISYFPRFVFLKVQLGILF